MPTSRMARAVSAGGRSIRMPHASSRSALPHWLGDRAVAVLGDVHARARHHERRDGRNVERVAAVAARAAGVEQRLRRSGRRPPATAICRMARAKPTSSSTVSPFIAARSERRRSAGGVASPRRIDLHGRLAHRRRADLLVRTPRCEVGQKRHVILECLAFCQTNTSRFHENSRVSGKGHPGPIQRPCAARRGGVHGGRSRGGREEARRQRGGEGADSRRRPRQRRRRQGRQGRRRSRRDRRARSWA